MYSNPYGYDDPWQDVQAAEREDAQVELDLARAEREKLEHQIKELQSKDPEALTARLAAELGQPIEAVKAQLQAAKQSTAPTAPSTTQPGDPDKLSELLDKLDPNDLEGQARAFDQAGYVTIDPLGQTHQGGRIQRPGMPQGSTEEIYAYLDGATSLEDYQARLASVGLLESGAV